MLLKELRTQVIEIARRISREGLVRATAGNVSAFDRDRGLLAITPSGMDYEALRPADIPVLDLDGNVRDGDRRPSVEHPLHRALLRHRPDAGAVIHTHAPHATAFACMNRDLPVISTEVAAMTGAVVRVAPYAESGTDEIAAGAVAAMGDSRAALLAHHGVVAIGRDLREAYAVAWGVETAAHLYLLARMLGQPQPLPSEVVSRLQAAYREYGQPDAGERPPGVKS